MSEREYQNASWEEAWGESPDRSFRPERGAMPVAREARAHAARKSTWRSRRASKRYAQAMNGLRNRRMKKNP